LDEVAIAQAGYSKGELRDWPGDSLKALIVQSGVTNRDDET